MLIQFNESILSIFGKQATAIKHYLYTIANNLDWWKNY